MNANYQKNVITVICDSGLWVSGLPGGSLWLWSACCFPNRNHHSHLSLLTWQILNTDRQVDILPAQSIPVLHTWYGSIFLILYVWVLRTGVQVLFLEWLIAYSTSTVINQTKHIVQQLVHNVSKSVVLLRPYYTIPGKTELSLVRLHYPCFQVTAIGTHAFRKYILNTIKTFQS